MKRSFFKQLMVSALFACSLSADVPDLRKQAEIAAVGVTTQQAGACSFGLCDGHARSMPAWPPALLAGAAPDPMALALSAVWPLDGLGIHPMDRAYVRWDVLPSINSEAMNVPMDLLDAVFLIPRYRMTLALQESAWLRPVGLWEPDQSLDVAGRSGRADMAAMIPRLKKVFVKEGVPQQWVWVAEVESALNPRAKSSAGAAGLFQLMPGTARRFGLRTAPVDDRMAPEKSAWAAAQYLKFLRQEFGCWSLALAAYNSGEGRVKEIMKKHKARTFNEVERYLPSETRTYVPKVMAIVALREDQLHGVPGAYWMPYDGHRTTDD
ncbi:MAG: lytic transglycosylase domain-containing protein [Kiritimatiellaeota bacterium]|nr:lytic transglycosylase domain-containing protein [Kiritimatiellota bacterium]